MPSQPRVAPGRAAQQVDALHVANWPFVNAPLVRISAEPGIEDEPGALVVSGARVGLHHQRARTATKSRADGWR